MRLYRLLFFIFFSKILCYSFVMEGFRILEITQPSEIHVTANQLTVEQVIEPKKKRKISIPLEDLELLICTGANIRLSTMALSVLSENKIGVVYNGRQFLEGRQPNSFFFNFVMISGRRCLCGLLPSSIL